MAGDLEIKALDQINFRERYIKARNEFQFDPEQAFKLSKKEILQLLNQQGLDFSAKGSNVFLADTRKGNHTFRLIFDINTPLIPLTYFWILENGTFTNNNIGPLDKLAASDGTKMNPNFGLNSQADFINYINQMQSIFTDFADVYLLLISDKSTRDCID